ncbi:nucleotidyltransferase family protein [Nocardia sp. X0981]
MAPTHQQLLHALTRAANALSHQGIPFAVAGGCAVYARGGPPSDHDVDLFVKPADCARARSELARAGLRIADAAEDWLTKAYDGDTLIDIIHRPNNREVDDALLDRAEVMRVGPTVAPVVHGTDLLVDKLLVFDAHRLDLSPLLRISRDLREQVDWPAVRAQTEHSPYARAFLGLIDDLGIADTRTPEPNSGKAE